MINALTSPFSKTKTLSFAILFTALSVLTPFLFHQIGGPTAGRIFLPMHIFVLAAGISLGWQVGLLVGGLVPLISYSFSGAPLLPVLPFIVIELAAYGFFAGFFRKSAKTNIWLSLIGAMILGRVFLYLMIFFFSAKLSAAQYVSAAILQGLPGILLQFMAIPPLGLIARRFLKSEK